jgi:hypothetical protein
MTDPSVVPDAGPVVPGVPAGGQDAPEAVAQALSRLEELEGRPVSDSVEVFDDVHRLLQDALATLDEV